MNDNFIEPTESEKGKINGGWMMAGTTVCGAAIGAFGLLIISVLAHVAIPGAGYMLAAGVGMILGAMAQKMEILGWLSKDRYGSEYLRGVQKSSNQAFWVSLGLGIATAARAAAVLAFGV